MISEYILKSLYLDQKFTTCQIAKTYNVNRKTVSRWLKKYNIPINHNIRKFENIKSKPLSQKQKEFSVGTLLGDGCVAKHGNSYRLLVGHCEKQKNYLLWKKDILQDLAQSVRKQIDPRGNSVMYNITTLTHPDFKDLYYLFYKNNKKQITDQLYTYLTPFSIAIWIMDDGSRYRNNIRISTDSFSEKEHLILQNILTEKYQISPKIRQYKRNDKILFYLSFNKKNSILLSKLIKPHIILEMQYKLCKL